MGYNYKIRVSLKGFEKKIKRTFIINDDVTIDHFCQAIITSMNGYLEHLYVLKYKDKYYICNEMEEDDVDEIKMNYLEISELMLKAKDKLELIYDFGDNWVFKISVSKVMPGHNEKNIELVAGIGKGIEEDCGGNWGLEDLIDGTSHYFHYDYNDFDLNQINEQLDQRYNAKKQKK